MIKDEDQVLFVRIHFVTETENLTNLRGNRSTRLPFRYSDTQTLKKQCKGIIFDTFFGFSEAKDINAFFTSHFLVIHIL